MDIGGGNGLEPLGTKPLPQLILAKFYDAI